MKNSLERKIEKYVETHIPVFHSKRLELICKLKLKQLLKRKNPYLFRVKNISTASEFVKVLLDAYLTSQEETIFGTFLEGLAQFVCATVFNGRKSAAEGIDLEFEKEGVLYIVSIKSGPHWGNSSQIARMKDTFKKAKRILGSNRSKQNIVAVNGCCYGQHHFEDQGDYIKLCGEKFWTFISGISSFYIDIIKPLGHTAKERNEAFYKEYAYALNRFTKEFLEEFCNNKGAILWGKIVHWNSSDSISHS